MLSIFSQQLFQRGPSTACVKPGWANAAETHLSLVSSRVGPRPPGPTYRLYQVGVGHLFSFADALPVSSRVGHTFFLLRPMLMEYSIFPSDRHFAGRKPSSQANGCAAARLMPLGTACQVAPGKHSYGVAVWCERSSLAFLSRSPSPPDPTDVAPQLPPNHHQRR